VTSVHAVFAAACLLQLVCFIAWTNSGALPTWKRASDLSDDHTGPHKLYYCWIPCMEALYNCYWAPTVGSTPVLHGFACMLHLQSALYKRAPAIRAHFFSCAPLTASVLCCSRSSAEHNELAGCFPKSTMQECLHITTHVIEAGSDTAPAGTPPALCGAGTSCKTQQTRIRVSGTLRCKLPKHGLWWTGAERLALAECSAPAHKYVPASNRSTTERTH
jgi:hypothetical protein